MAYIMVLDVDIFTPTDLCMNCEKTPVTFYNLCIGSDVLDVCGDCKDELVEHFMLEEKQCQEVSSVGAYHPGVQ